MSEPTHYVARSMAEAAAAATRLIEQAVDHAVAELQSAESRAAADQRQQLADAWRELLARRRPWGERYSLLLRAAFEAEASGKAQAEGAAPPPEALPSGFLALSLVDDTEIARKIESSRLAQQLTSMLERPLSELDGLMSTALGLPTIQPERNPLRPVVYAKVLRTMMEEKNDIDPALPSLWLKNMVQPMAQALEALYREQSERLTQAQVQSANYRLVTVPSSGKPATRPAPFAPASSQGMQPQAAAGATSPALPAIAMPPARNPQATPSASADLPLQAVDGPRLQQFLERDDPRAREAVASSFQAQAEAELRELEASTDAQDYDSRAAREHMHLPAVERPARAVDTDSPLPEEVWGAFSTSRERSLVRGRLKTQAREVGQVLGLEVVRRLINKVAEDPRLLTPVREAIVALEPSLARLAMVAPRFFSDERHPGRLLVERVAERSFKYNDEFSVEFQAFLRPVAQTFTRLNEIEDLQNAIAFQAALATLQAGWSAQDTLDEEAQRKVLEAVQYAERRQQEADRTAADLRLRPDLPKAPPAVQDFILGTWAVVIAHARLAQQGGVDPGGHIAVVTDLLWSVDRDQALHDPARAFVLIPRVLLKLREGLATLGQAPAESEAFFHELEKLHRPVMKLRAKHRHRDVAPPEPPPAPAAAVARAPDQPWMPVEDLQAVGFEAVPSDFSALAPAHGPTRTEGEPLGELEAEERVDRLGIGEWVDLFSRQHWRRARLMWAAEKRTLFMFVSDGGQPHSMTRRSLQKLVRERLLRPVEADGVVPRALAKLGRPSAPMPLAA